MNISKENIQSNRQIDIDKERIVIIDGGFSAQLSCHVQDRIDGDVLWTARFLATNPQAVISTHLDFLEAGADVIITDTYQASLSGFMEHLKLSREESYNLIKKAVSLARTARKLYEEKQIANDNPNKPLIAGSVGPYGASLHDLSEYTGSYVKSTSTEILRDWHRPRIEALLEEGVDLLAIETIPSRIEAEMLINLIKEYPQAKAWLSLSCSNDGKSTAFGDDFQDTVKYCYDLNPQQIVAVGANCFSPRLAETLFNDINKGRENNPIPIIIYPNSGETYTVETGYESWVRKDECKPLDFYVQKWLDMGIRWIGGCCRTYAADISKVKSEVLKWKQAQSSNNV